MGRDARASLRRLGALTKKEFLQLVRDRSTILMGVVLPLVLVLLIGFGMSLDVRDVPTAVVLEDDAPSAREAARFLDGSAYFSPRYVRSMEEAEALLLRHEADAIFCVPPDFSAELARGEAKVQLILNGVEATTAMSVSRYVEAAVLTYAAGQHRLAAMPNGAVQVEGRIWFNDANTSTWFYVPGILMLVLTMSGVFLTSVVMARERERGTFESLFVTPVRIYEIILGKVLPYFVTAMLGMFLCLMAGHFLYALPMRGSMALILLVSMLYIVVALSLGLVISAVTKNQYVACQISSLVSFLPSVMLSGYLFDLHSEPLAIRVISRLFPTTYYLQLMKSLFLSGDYWPLIARNGLVLAAFAAGFAALALHLTRKKVA